MSEGSLQRSSQTIKLTCSPSVEGRLIIAIIVVTELPVGIKKTILDSLRCQGWEVTVYLLDIFL